MIILTKPSVKARPFGLPPIPAHMGSVASATHDFSAIPLAASVGDNMDDITPPSQGPTGPSSHAGQLRPPGPHSHGPRSQHAYGSSGSHAGYDPSNQGRYPPGQSVQNAGFPGYQANRYPQGHPYNDGPPSQHAFAPGGHGQQGHPAPGGHDHQGTIEAEEWDAMTTTIEDPAGDDPADLKRNAVREDQNMEKHDMMTLARAAADLAEEDALNSRKVAGKR